MRDMSAERQRVDADRFTGPHHQALQELSQRPVVIHYDITDVLEYARRNSTLSGIQRVSIQLINHIVNKYGTKRLRLIGFHPAKQRIMSFDPSYFGGDYRFEQGAFCRHFDLHWAPDNTRPPTDFQSYIRRKYKPGWQRRIHRNRLRVLNALSSGKTFRKRNIVAELPPPATEPADTFLAPGDIVFVVGATWGFQHYIRALTDARRERGIKLYHFIHDLIPLLTPEHVERGHIETFRRWLEHLSQNTDCFITNSVASKDDLDGWQGKNGTRVETRVLPLAHQFCDSPRRVVDPEHVDQLPHARMLNVTRLPYALCVGTIESRKNVWTLAKVWQRVLTKLGDETPRLIFAGKHGWLKEDFDDFIRGTSSLYGYIRIVERPSDPELAYLYRKCLFLMLPSYKEGWGLPIGECMWFGRPVICSSVSSMPEVGGTLADYVDPKSLDSIETAVVRMITDPAYRERRASEIAAARLRTWAAVADDLWRELSTASSRPSRRRDE